MLQRFTSDLQNYHRLFQAGRCAGWEQEELIVNAIKSDTQAQHQVFWKEAGHDDKADITVRTNGDSHKIQIKSGRINKGYLILSGHRLGRFKEDFGKITEYLNNNGANIISVPYEKIDDSAGRKHCYQVSYIDVKYLTEIDADDWQKHGAAHEQTNRAGVVFSLRPSMSWQIWWKIPVALMEKTPEIVIG